MRKSHQLAHWPFVDRNSLAMYCDRAGEVLLHFVRHSVLDQIYETVRLGGDLGRVVASPRVVSEVRQIGFVLGLG